MNNEQLKAKLLWRCRRGMKELDVLLQRYVNEVYFQTHETKRQAFNSLLMMQDPELYNFITGRIKSIDKDIMNVIATLTEYHQP